MGILAFEGLTNVRDLGGLPAKEGAIRPNLLIRSGKLADASAADLQHLRELGLTRVYDFRVEGESQISPDPSLPGVTYHRLPPLDRIAPGITRDEDSDFQIMKSLFKKAMKKPQVITDYMVTMYHRLVLEPFGQIAYATFLNELASREAAPGVVLFHCTAGKDRAGLATALLLSSLGVSKDIIMEDYLLSNRFVEPGIQDMLHRHVPWFFRRTAETPMRMLFEARPEYLQGAWNAMEESSGSIDAYLADCLGIDDEKKRALRQRYLEPHATKAR